MSVPALEAAVVREELTRLLYRQAYPSYLTSIVLALLLTSLLWSDHGSLSLGLWLATLVAVYALRAVLVFAHRRFGTAMIDAAAWAWWYASGALLGGAVWGSLAWIWSPEWEVADQTILLLSLAGMAAGSATAHAPRMSAYLAFLLPCLLPIMSRGLLVPHPSLGLSGVVLLYMAGLTYLARNQHDVIVSGIATNFENQSLTADLTRHVQQLREEAQAHESARNQLKALNETLEQRVAERAQALNAEAKRNLRIANALKLANRRSQMILNAAGEGILGIDAEGRATFVNPAAARILGWDERVMLGRPYAELLFGGRQQHVSLTIEKTLREGSRQRQEKQSFLRADGVAFPVEFFSTPIQDMHQIIGAVITFVDVTNRQKAEAALQDSERRFAAIVNSAQDAIALLNDRLEVVFWNQAAATTFQYAGREAQGRSIYELLAPDRLRPVYERAFRQLSKRPVHGSAKKTLELKVTGKSGREIPVELSIAQVTLDLRRHFILVARDISERKQSEQALASERALYQTLVDNLPLSIFYKAADGTYISANRHFVEDLDITPAELEGKTDFDLFPRELAETYRNNDCRALESGIIEDSEIHYRHNGEERFAHTTVTALKDPAGRPASVLGIISDITEQKREERERLTLEIKLRHAQKLEAVGQLAAGIAHEINTPIQFVSDNTRFLKEAFQDIDRLLALQTRLMADPAAAPLVRELRELSREMDLEFLEEEIPKAIEQSLEGLSRIAHIVQAMKEFSHPGAETKIAVDINKAIEATADVSRNEWKYHAKLQLDLDPELPQVPALPVEINQMLLNIVVNAAHAVAIRVGDSGEKGNICISTRHGDNDVEIRIADDGCGMPENVRQRIFEPFFTTKEVGKGTGQGLAIAYSAVVDKHGGTIDVSSEPGKGTTFTVRLPLETAAQEARPA